MSGDAHLAEQSERGVVLGVDPAYVEDVVRAHADAVSLCFATAMIDQGNEARRWLTG